MTTPSDDRLGRVERDVRELKEDMHGLMSLVRLLIVRAENQDTLIRGLKLEQSRILEHLFGQEEP